MRGLLLALKTELSGIFPGLNDRDIYFIPNPNVIPSGAKLPCIGIKDGDTINHDLMGGVDERELKVTVYYYDKAGTHEECIPEFLLKGELIRDRLKENNLNGYVKDVDPKPETPIHLMVTKKGSILRKGLKYQYEREE